MARAKKKKTEEKKLEDTMRIRVDKERLNDSSSLDVSFLEEKAQKKASEDETIKEKILEEEHVETPVYSVFKVLFCLLLILGLAVLIYYAFTYYFSISKQVKEQEEEIVQKKDVDDNYLFVGDFHTNSMTFDFFTYPYVKESYEEMTTKSILENMQDTIYVYNPSAIFLEVGMGDLLNGDEEDVILGRFKEIIEGIQRNRPLATIYVESLYPVNPKEEDYPESYQEIDNEQVQKFNEKLEETVVGLNATYLDVFTSLSEEGVLKESCSDDGVHLNTAGYDKVWKAIRRIIQKEKE